MKTSTLRVGLRRRRDSRPHARWTTLNVSLQHSIATLAASWSARKIARELQIHREMVLLASGSSGRFKTGHSAPAQ
jgi:hypothetical protein